MKPITKIVLTWWLIFCGLFSWVAFAFINMVLTMIGWHVLATFTPLIGLSVVFCIIKFIYGMFKNEELVGETKI